MKLRIMILTTLLISGPAKSAAPPVIPVQGLLTSAAGEPLDGEQTVTFAIYDDHAAGNLLWSEIQDVTVSQGLFSVYLGAVETLDLALFKSQDDLWLGIKVDDDPEMTRVHLGTTPFAAFAQHGSYSAGLGVSISAGNIVSSTLGDTIESNEIADGSVAAVDLADQAVTLAKLANNAVTSAKIADATILTEDLAQNGCTAGQVLKWDGSAWSCSDEYRPILDCTLEQCQAAGMGCQIDCPSGYTTIGCGARSTDPLRMRGVYYSGNGCYCEIQGGSVTCQARCCRIQ